MTKTILLKSVFLILFTLLVGCQPSQESIEQAIAETQMVQVTNTPQPTSLPTSSPTPEPSPVCDIADAEIVPQGWHEEFCQTFSEDATAEGWIISKYNERDAVITMEVYKGLLGVRAVVEQPASYYTTAPVSDLRDFMVSVEGRMSMYSGNPYHDWGIVLKESKEGYYIFKNKFPQKLYFPISKRWQGFESRRQKSTGIDPTARPDKPPNGFN